MHKLFRFIKGLNKAVGIVIGLGLAVFFLPFGMIAKYTDRFSSVTLMLSHIPLYIGEFSRYFFYKVLLKKLGSHTVFKYGSYCEYADAEIGDHVTIGYYTSLGLVQIGDDVIVGKNVDFLSGLEQHSFMNSEIKIRLQPGKRKKITIGSDVWIGSNSSIAADICDRCVIGVGSIVIKKLEEKGVYAGNPARKVSNL